MRGIINMKPKDIEYIIKQTLIEASLHHEEDRQRYYNSILELVNYTKHLEFKLKQFIDEINKDPI
jgi:tartrate dehydratase alpha subunit/fumarate hydratase class I-like protein